MYLCRCLRSRFLSLRDQLTYDREQSHKPSRLLKPALVTYAPHVKCCHCMLAFFDRHTTTTQLMNVLLLSEPHVPLSCTYSLAQSA